MLGATDAEFDALVEKKTLEIAREAARRGVPVDTTNLLALARLEQEATQRKKLVMYGGAAAAVLTLYLVLRN